MKKIKDSIIFKIIMVLLKIAMYAFILCFLAVVLIQRIFNNEVSFFGYKMFNIVSESMIPKYQTSDILIVRDIEDFSTLKIGDDVVYEGSVGTFDGKIVTHQIIDIGQDENGKYIYTTKGINNTAEDPLVSQDQLLGIVVYKTIILSWLSELLTNAYGFYFLIFIPLCIMIFLEIKDMVDRKKEEEYAEEDDDNNDNDESKENEVEDKNDDVENKENENTKSEAKIEKNTKKSNKKENNT